jgi:hypothetical protein
VAVDLPNLRSNQHELNGDEALKEFFGIDSKTRGNLSWHYFSDDHETSQEENEFTFYDARAKTATRTGRSEWRFYYYGSFLSRARVGDWLILAKPRSGKLFALVFQKQSAWLRAAQVLFGIERSASLFDSIKRKDLDARQLEFLQRQILDELDLALTVPAAPNDEELMLAKFGRTFPATRVMSEFARAQVAVEPNKPDDTLIRWLDREEALFRALENVVIGERLKKGFSSVDDFITYSLSAQNRRKSRMGFALQNHLAELFTRHNIRFSPQARTEGRNQPDFIFPGAKEYHDPQFEAAMLVMLGVKSSAKDRWRQVLTEADKIPRKHLCTLEAGISSTQTDEMRRQQLTLVVPLSIHSTYTKSQLHELLTLSQFIDFASHKQRRA